MSERYQLNGKIKALVVDDDGYVRSYVRRLLEAIGLKLIFEAADGGEALDRLGEHGADLVFLDLDMEPVNGLEFLKAVRVGDADAPRDLPVVVLTGLDDGTVFGTALALDCDAFLAKPGSQTEIAENIWRTLLSRPAIKPAAAYQVIPVGAGAMVAPTKTAEARLPVNALVVSLDGLRPGQVLACDVTTVGGNVLMTAGTRLTRHLISRLREIADMAGLTLIAVEGRPKGAKQAGIGPVRNDPDAAVATRKH